MTEQSTTPKSELKSKLTQNLGRHFSGFLTQKRASILTLKTELLSNNNPSFYVEKVLKKKNERPEAI